MATNEQRARLIGKPENGGWWFDSSLDACAELLRFVRERGKEIKFVYALDSIVRPNTRFNLIAATPQQLCAAFDATFKDELEKIQ